MFEIVLTERASTSRRLLRGGLVLLVVAVVLSTMVIAIIQTHLLSLSLFLFVAVAECFVQFSAPPTLPRSRRQHFSSKRKKKRKRNHTESQSQNAMFVTACYILSDLAS